MHQETVQNLILRYSHLLSSSLLKISYPLYGEIFWTLIKGKEQLLIKIEPPVQAQPDTNFGFLDWLENKYRLTEEELEKYQEEQMLQFLSWFEWFKMREMYSKFLSLKRYI